MKQDGSVLVAYIDRAGVRLSVAGQAVAAPVLIPFNLLESPEKIQAELNGFLSRDGVGILDKAVISVSRELTAFALAEIPAAARKDSRKIISIELDSLFPAAPEDMLFDIREISESEGKVKILVVAVKRALVDSLAAAIEKAGLWLKIVEPEQVSIARIPAVRGNITGGNSALALSSGEFYSVVFFDGNGPVMEAGCLSSSLGLKGALEEAVSIYSRRFPGVDKPHKWLVAGCSVEPGLSISGAPVSEIAVGAQAAADGVARVFEERGDKSLLNLWPVAEPKNISVFSFALAVLLLVFAGASFLYYCHAEEEYWKAILNSTQKAVGEEKEIIKANEKLSTGFRDSKAVNEELETLFAGRISISNLLRELNRLMPPSGNDNENYWIQDLSFRLDTDGYRMGIMLVAPKAESLELQEQFGKSKMFEGVVVEPRQENTFLVKMKVVPR